MRTPTGHKNGRLRPRLTRTGGAALAAVLAAASGVALAAQGGAGAAVPSPARALALAGLDLVLPVHATGSTTATTVPSRSLTDFSAAPWFTTAAGSGVTMRADTSGAPARSERFPQTQLREAATWTTSDRSALSVRQAVTHLPASDPAVVVAAVHVSSAPATQDLLQVRATPSRSGDGTVRVCVRFGQSTRRPCLTDSYPLGTPYDLGIAVTGGTISVSFNGTVGFTATTRVAQASYRVGTSLLTRDGSGPADYGATTLYKLAITHPTTAPPTATASSPVTPPTTTPAPPKTTPAPPTSSSVPVTPPKTTPAPPKTTPAPPKTTSAAPSTPVTHPARWVPTPGVQWQWQLSSTPTQAELTAAYNAGARAFDIDGDGATSATVAAIHALGQDVGAVCYIDVGGWEDYRSDAANFPASVKGDAIDGWPSERWLDVRQTSVLRPLMQARIQMCADKGFDAVEPDLLDGYSNTTGFPITAAQQITYNTMIAGLAHDAGLSVTQKGDSDQAAALQPYFDWTLNEQCGQYDECSSLAAYKDAGKAVWIVEYSGFPQACASDYPYAGSAAMLKNLDLSANPRTVCTSTKG